MLLVESKAGHVAKPPAGRISMPSPPKKARLISSTLRITCVDLVSVGEEVEHLAVAQELVHVVEVPAATPVDRPVGVRGELAAQGVDDDELFEEGAPRMKDGNLEGRQVVELAEVGPGGHEHVAEEGADRHLGVGMGPTPDAHLKKHAGADERGRLPGGGVGDLVGTMAAGLASPNPSRRAADSGGRSRRPWPS